MTETVPLWDAYVKDRDEAIWTRHLQAMTATRGGIAVAHAGRGVAVLATLEWSPATI
jgi:hypothetical protein